MLKWVLFLSVALLLLTGHVVAEKLDRDREEKWSTEKKMVVGGGALVTGIAGIAALPFLFGFSPAGVVTSFLGLKANMSDAGRPLML